MWRSSQRIWRERSRESSSRLTTAGLNEVADLVFPDAVVEVLGQRVGQLDIADASVGLVDHAGNALVALAADTHWPSDVLAEAPVGAAKGLHPDRAFLG
jgi:hypothetical protein